MKTLSTLSNTSQAVNGIPQSGAVIAETHKSCAARPAPDFTEDTDVEAIITKNVNSGNN